MAETKKKEVKKTVNKKEDNDKTITGLELKWEVVLVYVISILGFIFSFMKNEKVSKNARFHYKQSGTLFIISLGVSIIYRILAAIAAVTIITTAGLGIISIIFEVIFGTIYAVFAIALLAFIIITIIKAFNDETYRIPFISSLAEKIWKD